MVFLFDFVGFFLLFFLSSVSLLPLFTFSVSKVLALKCANKEFSCVCQTYCMSV